MISDLAQFHNDFANFDNTPTPEAFDIHMNLPDEPERDIFFAWHRRQIFELEQAMQDLNPNLSMPFWDTALDQSIDSPLWDEDFLGSFDSNWELNRTLGVLGPLPTIGEVNTIQSRTDFLDYSNRFERQSPHVGGHRWVGGAMVTSASPRDPVFYLHHTNVDRLWVEWEEINQGSFFQMTWMVRYDGTYVFDGETLPLVNPNDIIDNRSLGIFYATNGEVRLDNYVVNNQYRDLENFYYQYVINVGDDFTIPTDGNCKIESVNEINFLPGFSSESGSNLIARIGVIEQAKDNLVKIRNKKPFTFDIANYDLYSNVETPEISDSGYYSVYPNPFTDRFFIRGNENSKFLKATLHSVLGVLIFEKEFSGADGLTEVYDFGNVSPGMYILTIQSEAGKSHKFHLIKN